MSQNGQTHFKNLAAVVFSLNAGKYGPEITPYLDTFRAVLNEKTANPAKTCVRKILRTRKKLRTGTCRCKFIKMYFLKNAKKLCKPNNRDLNRDCIINVMQTLKNLFYKGALFM